VNTAQGVQPNYTKAKLDNLKNVSRTNTLAHFDQMSVKKKKDL
jgi:hypothetical protein